MKKLLVAAFFASLWFSPAQAQSTGRVVSDCTAGVPNGYGIGSTSLMTMNAAGQACITGSISASLAAFHAEASLTPITATTGGVTSSSFTAGKATLVSNTGATNTAFCAPGASASTSSTPILPGQTVEIQTTSETQITCVTSTSTTTVSIQTGTGLAAGWGGSGAGGGGGAVTLASGAVASGAYASGSIASGAFASGSIASGALASGSISNGASVAQGSTTDSPATLPASATAASQIALEKAIANAVSAPSTGLAGTTPTTSTPVASGATSAVQTDLHGNLYIAPSQVLTTGGATTANSVPMVANSQYPVNSVTTTPTPLVAKGTGSTGAVTGTLTPAATATADVCGFSVSYVGGTAAIGPLVLSGLLGGSFTYQIPLSATAPQTFNQTFTPCIPASAVNTAIVMTTVADGTATAVDVNIWGYGL